ncbi:hypothetical protein [Rouxiella sp. T17]|uniref:hypothetical protein n=1 Tax=Rouxiella sp. T17 TaxID=3085684 RepID=UPI003FA6A507
MNQDRPPRSFRLNTLLHVLMVLVLIAYPLAVNFGLKKWGVEILAPLLIAVFLLRLLTFRGKLSQLTALGKSIAITGLLLAAASGLLHETQMLLYYPVAVNGLLLLLFGYSLFSSPPIIERLARLTEPDLSPQGVRYTRRVTQVWCLFFIFNGGIALYTCLKGNLALWTFYNGGVSYLLIGLLMGIEWIVRKRVRKT